VVPHEVQRARAWQERVDGAFPVIADGGFYASCLYGVAFQMCIHTDTSNTPGAFLIDQAGILRFSQIGAGPRNFADRPSIEEVLSEIDSWEPGTGKHRG
jgi:hypothetical protein